ncbi:MAG: radical SAM protein [Candidatus Omnitrophica bacterium]|nr:radical SAM protein [Candidatus Omnitrophota bacterium]
MNERVLDLAPNTPPLGMLYFYMTSYCNCACKHCWIAPEYLDATTAPEEAPYETFTTIIDQAIPLGLQSIKFTGGEPLLSLHTRPLMKYAKEKNLYMTMETNGILIDDETGDFFKEMKLSHISISIDGPTAEIHEALRGVPGSFDKACRGVKICAERGFRPQVIMSLYRPNVRYILETARLAQSLGAASLKLNCINDIERGKSLAASNDVLSVKDYLDIKKVIDEEVQPQIKVAMIFDIPPVFSFFPAKSRHKGRCGIFNILGVLADGRMSICGIGASTPELLLGTIHERSLKEIWHDSAILKTLRSDLPSKLQGICGECMFKNFCLGKCRAEAFYSHGDLLAPFYFCEEADRLGLFPEKFKYKKVSI